MVISQKLSVAMASLYYLESMSGIGLIAMGCDAAARLSRIHSNANP